MVTHILRPQKPPVNKQLIKWPPDYYQNHDEVVGKISSRPDRKLFFKVNLTDSNQF